MYAKDGPVKVPWSMEQYTIMVEEPQRLPTRPLINGVCVTETIPLHNHADYFRQ